eukprot:Nk52_evm7s241 gene=Nk52_evmTU7s241
MAIALHRALVDLANRDQDGQEGNRFTKQVIEDASRIRNSKFYTKKALLSVGTLNKNQLFCQFVYSCMDNIYVYTEYEKERLLEDHPVQGAHFSARVDEVVRLCFQMKDGEFCSVRQIEPISSIMFKNGVQQDLDTMTLARANDTYKLWDLS